MPWACTARLTFALAPECSEIPGPGVGIDFGDYELIEELGRGGMGIVYRARQRGLDRIVAFKMILAGRFAGPSQIQRFHAEAMTAASLTHPNIVAIHEVGEMQGHHFFSMEYVDGKNMADIVGDRPLPARCAARYLRLIALAIQHAHEHGVVHRDLKPSNILIDASDHPKVSDFGLAKRFAVDPDLTSSGQVLGSPNFSSPEQAGGRSKAIGPPTDIYSLGALLYFLLTGRPPFCADSLEKTLQHVLNNEPVAPSLINPGIPRDLETICLKCLEKDPRRRYATARALAEDLERFEQERPIHARPVRATERMWRWCRRNPRLAGVSASALLLLLTIAIGSPMALVRIHHEGERARLAERETREKLRDSYLAQARANRLLGRSGRRLDSLELIQRANEIRHGLDLRDEAIACLTLKDVRLARRWNQFERFKEFACLDLNRDRYAYAEEDGDILICSIADDRELMRLPSIAGKVRLLSKFSPDGSFLVVWYRDNITRVWNLARQSVVLEFASGRHGDFTDFSPDGRRLAVCSNLRTVDLHDMGKGTIARSFPVDGSPNCVRFHPRENRLAVASISDGTIRVLDVESGAVLSSVQCGELIYDVAWHPGGEGLAAASADKHLYLWETRTSMELRQWQGHERSEPVRVKFHPSGRFFVSSGWDGYLRFWNFPGAEEILDLTGEGLHLEFDDSGRRMSCYGWNGNLPRIYDIAPFSTVETLQQAASVRVESKGTIGFSRDGRHLAVPTEHGVSLWHVGSLKRVAELPAGPTRSAFFAANDSELCVSGEGGVLRFALRPWSDRIGFALGPPEIVDLPGSTRRAVLREDGLMAVACDNKARLISPGASVSAVTTGTHSNLRFLALHPVRPLVATGGWDRRNVSVWDTDSGQMVHELKADLMPNVTFTADGQWLVVGDWREYTFWNTDTWQPARRIRRADENNSFGIMAFSANGQLLALAHTRSVIRLLRADTFEMLANLESPNTQMIYDFQFSPDSARLAVLRSGDVTEIWDLHQLRRELASISPQLDWDLPPPTPSRLQEKASVVTVNWPGGETDAPQTVVRP